MKKLGRIQTFAVAGLSALALATPLALAQTAGGEQGQQRHEGARGGRHGKGGDFGGRRGGHFGGGFGLRGVELTDEQKTRLAELRKGFGERTKSLREQLRARREELRQAESGTTFNEQLASQKLTESAGLQARLMAEEFRLRQESLAVLTPEQRTQLEQRRQQREQRREQFKAQRRARRQQQQ
ncbi:MAG TPA: Spy/CpxP family protein refolding chaperone [Pyrinomonadaceae bacterium]|jgi:protein CpxP